MLFPIAADPRRLNHAVVPIIDVVVASSAAVSVCVRLYGAPTIVPKLSTPVIFEIHDAAS